MSGKECMMHSVGFFSLISPSVFGKPLKCGLARIESWHFTFLAFFSFISLFLVPGLWLS